MNAKPTTRYTPNEIRSYQPMPEGCGAVRIDVLFRPNLESPLAASKIRCAILKLPSLDRRREYMRHGDGYCVVKPVDDVGVSDPVRNPQEEIGKREAKRGSCHHEPDHVTDRHPTKQ